MEIKSTTFEPANKKAKYSDAEDLDKVNNDSSNSKLSAHQPTTLEEPIKVDPTEMSENAIKVKKTIELSSSTSKTECSSDEKAEINVEKNNTCDKNESQADPPGVIQNTIKDPSAGTRTASVPIYIFGPKPPMNPGLFDCNKCSKNFESRALLNSHNISQHVKKFQDPKKPIVCDICDQGFKLFPQLVSHRNSTHRMLNPLYQSTTCSTNKGVPTIGDGNHGSGENDEKSVVPPDPKKGSFSCSQCPRTFVREKGLKSHFQYAHIDKIPDGPRPFVCDICNKSFLMGLALGTHRKAVHGKFRRK